MRRIYEKWSRSQIRRRIAGLLCCTIISTQPGMIQVGAAVNERMGIQLEQADSQQEADEKDYIVTGVDEGKEATPSNASKKPDTDSKAPKASPSNASEEDKDGKNVTDSEFTSSKLPKATDSNAAQAVKKEIDGRICIYDYEQLCKVGTDPYEDEDEEFDYDEEDEYDEEEYDEDEAYTNRRFDYYIMNDIDIPDGEIWNVPEDFNGSILPYEMNEEDTRVYDEETDTIYLHNIYQLYLLNSENAEEELVLTGDYAAESFGMGQVYTLEDGSHLTYGKEHNYVLASTFMFDTEDDSYFQTISTDMSDYYPDDNLYDGRNYFGQVVKTINGKDYILIGNEKQLRAIGSEKAVTEPIWKVYQTRKNTLSKWNTSIDPGTQKAAVLYYPGDADLIKFDNWKDWSATKLYSEEPGAHKLGETQEIDGSLILGLAATKRYYYVGSKLGNSGQAATRSLIDEEDYDEEFENDDEFFDEDEYDIDILDEAYEIEDESVVDGDGEAEKEDYGTQDPKLASGAPDDDNKYKLTYNTDATKNINIASPGSTNVTQHTYSNKENYIIFRDIDLSGENWTPIENFQGNMEGRLHMEEGRNVTISHVKIEQTANLEQTNKKSEYGIGFFRNLATPYSEKLTIRDIPIEIKNLTLSDVSVKSTATKVSQNFSLIEAALTPIFALLHLKSGLKPDPQSLATGGFVGAVRGNVHISDCRIIELSGVSNVNNWTGGFVGYSAGITKYGDITQALGGAVGGLSKLLNLIPFLGLGDLLTALINGGALDIKKLVPAGYVNPIYQNCSVSYTQGAVVNGNSKQYVGGFAGETIGTLMQNCTIKNVGTVSGSNYVGGFIGRSANAVIAGLLSDLGVNVLDNFPVNTILMNCKADGVGQVLASPVKDESGYAGGFIGAMSNSYAVDCTLTGLGTVKGKDYAGGFTGKADLGDLADINATKGLLNIVKELLTAILSGSTDAQILGLVGLRPSVITGCEISGNSISVEASGKHAGGLIGYAGAVQVSDTKELADADKTTSKNFQRMLTKTGLEYKTQAHPNKITSTEKMSVQAKEYAGGLLGKATMTRMTAVLNETLGVADYMRFELKDAALDGGTTGLNVKATDAKGSYAGGAIGHGTGGEVRSVSIVNLASVDAVTAAGGFGGYFGSGKFADVGGVNLLGLKLIKIDGLLSLGAMIETFTRDCSVAGLEAGYTVTTSADEGMSGGFIGECISGRTGGTSVTNLKSVAASMNGGKAGGFIGYAKAGDALAAAGENVKALDAVAIENLLGVISALRPEFNQTNLSYVTADAENAQVQADMAGGFVGDGEAVDINYGKNHSEATEAEGSEDTAVKAATTITGLSKVDGETYAGGFAGRLIPGDVAQTGSVKLLGLLDVTQLLSVMDVAYPRISESSITGENLAVTAAGKNGNTEVGDAGGYIGYGKAIIIENSDVKEVASVTGTYHAGGYIGLMRSGSAVDAGDDTGALLNSVLGKIVNLNDLAGVLQAASGKITNSKVSGVAGGMVVSETVRSGNDEKAANGYAGGYVGEMQSGYINNRANGAGTGKGTAVENLKEVNGLRYAGGFGGLVKAGSVAEVAENSSLLGQVADITGLLTILNAFVPVIEHASVRSVEKGFTVTVTGTYQKDETHDTDTGSAGGFIGCGKGVQIRSSDVDKLKNTKVLEPKDLQSTDGTVYFDETIENPSTYSVYGYRHAGGYIGKADMGSTATVGGINLLKKVLNLSNIASALSVITSIIEDSDVYGAVGGFNVLASETREKTGTIGKAGGYAGHLLGTQFQDCNSYNFYHIIGRESAGGYVGTMEPGNVANVVGGTEILGGLVKANSDLLTVLQSFVPVVRNSETTCVPCGGVVRADAEGSDGIYRGLAGGYVGYNYGGQISGNDDRKWRGEDYTGEQRVCGAVRIRSVYGTEYSGGYTGLMQCANVADTGNLSVLFGAIKLSNPLSVLQAVYPTETNTAVYGPLRKLDVNTWNSWVTHVGSYGSYGNQLQALGPVTDQKTLNEYIEKYAYGYMATAGRNTASAAVVKGGVAGGYVGRMQGGVITGAHGMDLLETEAFRSAGGFVGEMLTGSVANPGEITLGNIELVGTESLAALQTFVPVIKNSDVAGYQSGAAVKSAGYSENNPAGYAGGYVGRMVGGQIWGDGTTSCSITKLREVSGTSYVGGYAGRVDPGSAVALDTSTSQGLLNGILKKLLSTPEQLVTLLNATVSTIRYAGVQSWDDWGITVNGMYLDQNSVNTSYAKAAGGFAGSISGSVLGKKDEDKSGVYAKGIRSVTGGEYAGGCFGIADVSAVADVSGKGETGLLDQVLQLESVNVLDAFRPYVYFGEVSGSADAGLTVSANTAKEYGQNEELTYSGCAGGFGGGLMNGSVKDSHVTVLRHVTAPNSTGGFVGYSGKSGAVQVKKFNVLGDKTSQLLGGSLGVLNVFGSHIERSSVTGIPGGYTVQSQNGQEAIAGGFIGYANLAKISDSTAGDSETESYGIKQVASSQIAGGFAGRTSYKYLADIKLDSTLVDVVLQLLNELIKALYLDKLQNLDVLKIKLGNIEVDALYDGNLLHVNLLGLDISVGLSKKSAENNQQTDLAIITIGDSKIALPCNENGILGDDSKQNINIELIKANRTKIKGCKTYGISDGYDVYGGGSGNISDGTGDKGLSGGFVGYNDEGMLLENDMFRCDAIRGTAGKVGPFSGVSDLSSVYEFNTKKNIEGNANRYRVYRKLENGLSGIGSLIQGTGGNGRLDEAPEFQPAASADAFNIYTILHMNKVEKYENLKNADLKAEDTSVKLEAYVSDAKAVLMNDVPTETSWEGITPPPSQMQDPCDEFLHITINKVWKDFFNLDKLRPNSIHLTLWRKWTDGSGEHQEAVSGYNPFTWTPEDASKNTWQTVWKELPAYKSETIQEEDGTETTNTYYYTYYVTEAEVPGYLTSITYGDEFTITITNSHHRVLPDTGGRGAYINLLLGAVILTVTFWTGRIGRKREEDGAV